MSAIINEVVDFKETLEYKLDTIIGLLDKVIVELRKNNTEPQDVNICGGIAGGN